MEAEVEIDGILMAGGMPPTADSQVIPWYNLGEGVAHASGSAAFGSEVRCS